MTIQNNTLITYRTILDLNAILNRCTNKGIEVEVLMKLIDFKDTINDNVEKYKKVFKEIMKEFEIKEVNGQYDWTQKENPEKITERVNELFEIEVKVTGCNFLASADFIKLVDGFSLGDISFLKKYLVRKNK